MALSWEWVDTPLQELGKSGDFHELSRRFRGRRPVGLITPLENLDGYLVINLLAPEDHAFWNIGKYHVHQHLPELVGNKSSGREFLKDLSLANVSREDPSIRLFDAYTDLLDISGRSIPGFSHDRVSTPEASRLWSTGVRTADRNELIDYLERVVAQFGSHSFFAIDDSIVLGAPFAHDEPSFASYVFGRWVYMRNFGAEWRDYYKSKILAQLKWVVERLESGIAFDLPLEPIYVLHPPLSFALSAEAGHFENELRDATHREILSYRARFVRLLGWPIFYRDVEAALDPESTDYAGRYGISHPYDLVGELESYLNETKRRYPIIEEAPFFGADDLR